MARAPSVPPISIPHNPACCQACRQENIQLRIEVELLHEKLDTEKEFGRGTGQNLLRLEGRVDSLEERRARESGRNEVLDQVARSQAQNAQASADVARKQAEAAEQKTKGINWYKVLAVLVAIFETLQQLGVIKPGG